MATNVPVTLDTLITVKVSLQGSSRKFKIPLRDLGANVLPDKLRFLLSIPSNQRVVFERFSDSAGAYVTLDPENQQVYKTLFRAAKAKLKLRLRATVELEPMVESSSASQVAEPPSPISPVEPSSRQSAAPKIPSPPLPPTVMRPPLGPLVAVSPQVPPLPPPPPFGSFTSATVELSKSAGNPYKPAENADGDGEAPVPRSFPARDHFFTELANISRQRDLAIRMKEPPAPPSSCSWSVYCNTCDKPIGTDEHYHCSICDDGDYDLCGTCVDAGIHCPGEGHWLIKRFVRNGKVINSTTERIAPKMKESLSQEMPGAFTEENKPEPVDVFDVPKTMLAGPTRTCNSCVKIFPERDFVTCVTCDDYDLCIPCHVGTKHGHHPGHALKPATAETSIGPIAKYLCVPGRNVRHAAMCDGCDKFIYGVRHKCLNCPDWDYCSECVKNARFVHPMHRFVPIYEPLPEPRSLGVRHFGIYCDGPLCKDKANQSFIEGIRYKCAVCHDTDFCASCEALPNNKHNRTHPLIKFKTPVRNVTITTMGEDKHGKALAPMGDQPARRSTATETVPAPSANAASQVRTIVDLKPTEESAPPKQAKEKIQIKDLLAEPIEEKIKIDDLLAPPAPEPPAVEEPVRPKAESPKPETLRADVAEPVPASELNAHFIRDTVPDGTQIPPSTRFIQVWTLRNPGPYAWPAGCRVRYVGGDNMLNVDDSHPSSATDIAEATESNVVGRAVEVGEEIAFRILMKSPRREGTAISYWRLKAADGTPFGHRLWCHIDVTSETYHAAPPAVLMTTPDAQPPVHASSHLKAQLEQKQEEESTRQTSEKLREVLQAIHARHVEELKQSIAKASSAIESHAAAAEPSELPKAGRLEPEPAPRDEEPSEAAREEEEQQGSQMVFPKLEKESPISSTHEAVTAPETASPVPLASPSIESEDLDVFEDVETVELLEVDSDDGFATDEEYDILDASDEELI